MMKKSRILLCTHDANSLFYTILEHFELGFPLFLNIEKGLSDGNTRTVQKFGFISQIFPQISGHRSFPYIWHYTFVRLYRNKSLNNHTSTHKQRRLRGRVLIPYTTIAVNLYKTYLHLTHTFYLRLSHVSLYVAKRDDENCHTSDWCNKCVVRYFSVPHFRFKF